MADEQQLERLREALADRYDVHKELGSGGMATVYLRAEEHYLTFLETFTQPDPEYVWMREEAQRALEELARGR